jgi:hypothetical protein
MIKDSDVLNQIFYDKLINKINKNGYEIKTLQEARALTENFTGGGGGTKRQKLNGGWVARNIFSS